MMRVVFIGLRTRLVEETEVSGLDAINAREQTYITQDMKTSSKYKQKGYITVFPNPIASARIPPFKSYNNFNFQNIIN